MIGNYKFKMKRSVNKVLEERISQERLCSTIWWNWYGNTTVMGILIYIYINLSLSHTHTRASTSYHSKSNSFCSVNFHEYFTIDVTPYCVTFPILCESGNVQFRIKKKTTTKLHPCDWVYWFDYFKIIEVYYHELIDKINKLFANIILNSKTM